MQGQLDTPLNERGRGQAAAAGPVVAARDPWLVVTSDLARAADTAGQVVAAGAGPLRHDPRLRETHLGAWQGRTHGEIEADEPGALARWRAEPTFRPPGGETKVEVAARGRAALLDALAGAPDDAGARPLVLVAHGGLIAALTADLLGLPVERWAVLGGIGNTRRVELRTRTVAGCPGWSLEGWNLGG
ncbi:histidine phosphatase family protein [Rhodococcus aerolatus]